MNATEVDAKKGAMSDVSLFYETLVDGELMEDGINLTNLPDALVALASRFPGRQIGVQPSELHLEQAKIVPLAVLPEAVRSKTIELVLDVSDFNPNGDDATPCYGVVSVNAGLLARIAELRNVAIASGCHELRTWYPVDWQGDPRVDCEELVVGAGEFAFHALHKHGDFGFSTQPHGIDELLRKVAQAEPGTTMLWASEDVKGVWEDFRENEDDGEDEDEQNAPSAG